MALHHHRLPRWEAVRVAPEHRLNQWVPIGLTATVPEDFKIGMACDYIHWAGRLMRSDAAQSRFAFGPELPDFWRSDVAFMARITPEGQLVAVLTDPTLHNEFLRAFFGGGYSIRFKRTDVNDDRVYYIQQPPGADVSDKFRRCLRTMGDAIR